MKAMTTINILGCGAVGFPLAAFLKNEGHNVIAVRTSHSDHSENEEEIIVHYGSETLKVPMKCASLSQLYQLNGIIVITAKAFANEGIARRLEEMGSTGSVVLIQNGMGVEKPFLNASYDSVLRCVPYMTSQTISKHEYSFSSIRSSPVGVIEGDQAKLHDCVTSLNTRYLPFQTESDIQREVWKKTIINSVFNSICPLLEIDNGVFSRNAEAMKLAQEMVSEVSTLLAELQIDLRGDEILEQIKGISGKSIQLISTLQDIRQGRRTEMDFLNQEIVRTGAAMDPPINLPKIEAFGRLVEIKSQISRKDLS